MAPNIKKKWFIVTHFIIPWIVHTSTKVITGFELPYFIFFIILPLTTKYVIIYIIKYILKFKMNFEFI